MKQIILMRHGESQWNLENRLTGWTDIDLSGKGVKEATLIGESFKRNRIIIDKAYCSFLRRTERTLKIVLDGCGLSNIEIERSWRLNENHYGVLQGMYRNQIEAVYGKESAAMWLGSYNCPPPPLASEDIRNPRNEELYKNVPKDLLPLSESYNDLSKRVIPFWENNIVPSLKNNNTILVVAHGNSLREILKHLYGIREKDMFKINLPTAQPFILNFRD
jgi:2,3-bisphosphoglycerate-dependent phosphoglycerate mutase